MFERIMGINVIDEPEYQKYREAMLPILKSFGGAFGYDFRVSEVLLSKTKDKINRVFTIEFPSKQIMEDFFSFPAYLAVQNKHLKYAIDSKTVIAMHKTSAK
jgi:uncharacterized protein (DUF1330 family)